MDNGKARDIPPRSSSLEEIEAARKLLRNSQLSLNALIDLKYWDLELKIKEGEQEKHEIWFQDKKRTLSQADIDEESQNLTRKTQEREHDKKIIRDQRRRITAKSLAELSMINNMAGFDEFRPGRHDQHAQETFRKLLIQEHKSVNPEDKQELWCPVLRQYFPTAYIIASHVFPYRMGEDVMKQVFGHDSANEMFSARNGFLMNAQVEQVFDNYQIVIVPRGLPKDHEWKVRIVDKSLLKKKLNGGLWQDLDNVQLVFKGNCRPAARYLYWHYCLAVIHGAGKGSSRGWREEMGKDCWATPGKYIRANMLRALAEQIGHCVPEDLPEPDLSNHLIEDDSVHTVEDQATAAFLMDDSDLENSGEDDVDYD